MKYCTLKNCQYHEVSQPYCKMDECLQSEDSLESLRREKLHAEIDQLARETCEEFYGPESLERGS